MISSKIFSDRLKSAREAAHFQQKELSEVTGIVRQTLSNYENGRLLPTLENAFSLAKALDVPAAWLVGAEDTRTFAPSGYRQAAEMIVALSRFCESAISSEHVGYSLEHFGSPSDCGVVKLYDSVLSGFCNGLGQMKKLLSSGVIGQDIFDSWVSGELLKLERINKATEKED